MITPGMKYKCMVGHNGNDNYHIVGVHYCKFNPEFVSELVYLEDALFTVHEDNKERVLADIFGSRRVLTELVVERQAGHDDDVFGMQDHFVIGRCTKIVMANKRVYYALP